MNILVTGGTGFIGSHLLKLAKRRAENNDWTILALSSREIDGVPCVLHQNYTFKKEDFYTQGIEHIDAVIHLGGFSPRGRSEMGLRDRYLESIKNTDYLLEHLPNVPSRFIYCSTISVYSEMTGDVITEQTVPQPSTLYGAYKLFCEKMISEWASDTGTVAQIMRLGNAYGPGEDRYQHIIPIMIQQVLRGETLCLTVDPAMRRNYIYVDDACNMMLDALELQENIRLFNLVSAVNVSMGELAQAIASLTEPQGTWTVKDGIELGKDKDVIFDNNKSAQFLGDEQVPLKEGLRREFIYFSTKMVKNGGGGG